MANTFSAFCASESVAELIRLLYRDMITFPAIAISLKNSFIVVDEMETSCNYIGWKNKYFEDLFYFDSAGQLWPVSQATPVRTVGIFDRLFNRTFDVDIKLGKPLENPLETAQSYLTQLIRQDADDLYNQFVSRDELHAMIRNSTTPSALINVARTLGESIS